MAGMFLGQRPKYPRKGCKDITTEEQLLKPCPFCGTTIHSDEKHRITGKHKENCFFMLIANAENYDLNNPEDLIKLREAWNTREG